MSEIVFLTNYSKGKKVIVYAGAAPGTHINYLSIMFPELQFILVDPARFSILPSYKIKIYKALFTDEVIDEILKQYNSEEILFISDIRSRGHQTCVTQRQLNEFISADMELQKNWVIRMKPAYSLLKFRLPFNEETTVYLKGDIWLPVFGRQNTTETRLLVPGDSIEFTEYDNKAYEEQLFHFNVHERIYYYEHGINNVLGLDHCFDCASEVRILNEYIKYADITTTASELSNTITMLISGGHRTLETVINKKSKDKWFSEQMLESNSGKYENTNEEKIKKEYLTDLLF